ncbi:D-alanyl-D-alanine carboxypeptidase family protein [Shouchella shacheensis]|uniref:D-alanyl-D-alanine carboxypeptidase family protein n=1 Tax=Shouchella shacheensis TaxID=1649580 RepID=UPI00073FE46D|nr:D-alanyl-D-alanine carboxypeptidase family protein [Shouchella shacheensis]
MIKKIVQVWVATLLIAICLTPVASAATERNFVVSAQGAILMEESTGRVLYAKNEHQPMKIASTTKIMTAILAAESGQMDEMVAVSSNAEGTEGSSLYLRAGEKVKLEDLVYGLMLRSGNDAAVAIAEHVGGSLDGFIYLMNEKAQEIGMSNTVFRNPHGLDTHEDHLSSAYDMAILTQYAMQNEAYEEITGTKDYRVEDNGLRVWHNKNRLLTEKYEHSTGGKTGYTKLAKRTLVSTASKGGLDLVAVTLNDPNDWEDHMHMFNWAFDAFHIERLVNDGPITGISDPFYADHIYVPHEVNYPLTFEEQKKVENELTLYEPPTSRDGQLKSGQTVGELTFYYDNERLVSAPVLYEAPEEENSFWDKLQNLFSHITGAVRYD